MRGTTRLRRRGLPGISALALAAALAPGLWASVHAQNATAVAVPARPVYTRAVVRSLPGAAEPSTVRLKLMPRGKVPFSTLSFQVDRPALLEGLAVGDEVGFVAESRPGGNTLTRIRKVAPCVRFQPCPVIQGD